MYRWNPAPRLIDAEWHEFRGRPTIKKCGQSFDDKPRYYHSEAESGDIVPVVGGVIEPLYHATPKVSAILAEGFKTGRKAGYSTLGGSSSYAVSFTQDLDLACEIAYSIKEAILIAQHRLTLSDIVRSAEHQGIFEEALHWWDIYGTETPYTNMSHLMYLDLYLKGLIYDKSKLYDQSVNKALGDLVYIHGYEYSSPEVLEKRIDLLWRPATPHELRQVTWGFYKAYLRAASEKKVRSDPLFMNRIEAFESLDINDVGVIEASLHNAKLVFGRYDEMVPGSFLYRYDSGRSKYAPDRDEYKVLDTSSLIITGVVECLEPVQRDWH